MEMKRTVVTINAWENRSAIYCDRCGKDITEEFYECGGNCISCGDDLCLDCAESWSEDGDCKRCQDSYKNAR